MKRFFVATVLAVSINTAWADDDKSKNSPIN